MRATGMTLCAGGTGRLALWAMAGALGLGGAAEAGGGEPDRVAVGREIFNREWLPEDPRGHGGDGLGPVYNDTSCVACHNAGGPGGAGPSSKNIDILSASRNVFGTSNTVQALTTRQVRQAGGRGARPVAQPAAERPAAEVGPLAEFHAGFRGGRTVVLHRFGTDPNYEAWRLAALGVGQFANVGVPQQAVFVGGMGGFSGGMGGMNNVDFQAQLTGFPAPVLPPTFAGDADPSGEPAGAFASDVPVSGPASARAVEGDDPARDDLPAGGGPVVRRRPPSTRMTSLAPFQAQPPAAADVRAQQAMQMASLGTGGNAGQRQIQVGEFTLTRSQRNPTPLFGLGQIDAIPERVIEAAARTSAEFPEVRGRVSRLKDGRVGRLGWKGQTASTEDFVLTACAVELGLEVPGHEQAALPQAPKYRAGGLDLDADECAALVAYVRDLPAPVERKGSTREESRSLAAGKAAFASVGCASCHAPKLGAVDGLYSDLLLHDMGPNLADLGSYNGSTGDEDDNGQPVILGADGQPTTPPRGGATRQEWRTPPLWGVRDSGPYLHDGRAETIDQAVALHGGQAAASAQRYFKLPTPERRQVEAFLKTLVAPPQLARAGD